MYQTIQQLANQRSGYLGQTFENEVRTALRTAGRDALSPKTSLFWDMYSEQFVYK